MEIWKRGLWGPICLWSTMILLPDLLIVWMILTRKFCYHFKMDQFGPVSNWFWSAHTGKVSSSHRHACIFGQHQPKRSLMSLMSWVCVIPKVGWARVTTPILLLVWHWLFIRFFFFEKSVSYQKKDRRCHACPSICWYDNDSGHKRAFIIHD